MVAGDGGAGVFLLVSGLLLAGVAAFNLDPRIPIIKRGQPDTYFGYSIAQHRITNERNIDDSWMLVGAPLGNNLQPGTNRSGALWKCPVTTWDNDCEQVVTDGRRNRKKGGSYDKTIDSKMLEPPQEDEIKNGQWLGVTVRSQGPAGKVMVCAHRYIHKGKTNEFQWGLGLCYTLNNNLGFDETWEPCKGRPVQRGHEQYGYCQAGTSGLLLPDDEAVIGTPGLYTWRGTVYVVNVSSEFLSRDKTLYYGPVDKSPVDKYSYLGMSVTAARFLDPYETSYAAGAPRANGTGQVVLFQRASVRTNAIMDFREIIQGEQFASSFGYEITNADINGDGLPDLIVGAPFYFSRDEGGAVYVYLNTLKDSARCLSCKKPLKLTGKPESRYGFALTNLGDLNKDGYEDIAVGAPYEDSGVVYIYLGSKDGLIAEPAQVIRSTDLPKTTGSPLPTFGYSLSGRTDLDLNGYPDLLIGAYEADAVVLLRARPIIGINTTISPVANLKKVDPTRPGCSNDTDTKLTCFTFRACCAIDRLVKPGISVTRDNRGLVLRYILQADTGRKLPRVWLGRSLADSSREEIIELDHAIADPLIHCEEEIVYIKENTRDIQSPIKFKVSYTLVQQEARQVRQGDPLPHIDSYPILNQQQAAKTFQASFKNDCGDDDICQSRTRIRAYLDLPLAKDKITWDLELGRNSEIVLNITVKNDGESAFEAKLFVAAPENLHFISYKAGLKHITCKTAQWNRTLVSCSIGNPLKRGPGVNLALRFDPSKISRETTRLSFALWSNSTSQEREPLPTPIAVIANVIRRAEISIKGSVEPDHVFYGGTIRGESALEYRDEIGPRVQHIYTIFNEGPSRAEQLQVNIEWPYQIKNHGLHKEGKWLLYLEEPPIFEATNGGECFVPQQFVNPLNLTERPGGNLDEIMKLSTTPASPNSLVTKTLEGNPDHKRRKRRRRDTEPAAVRAEAYLDKDGTRRQMVNMNCLYATARCFTITCFINNLSTNQEATINIRARLWNATLAEDYPRVDSVTITSRAKVHTDSKQLIIQYNTTDDETSISTVAYPDRLDQTEPESVDLWIILVSIFAGLLLLILLIIILWKVGFFRRRRPDPTLSGNLEKHRDQNGDY